MSHLPDNFEIDDLLQSFHGFIIHTNCSWYSNGAKYPGFDGRCARIIRIIKIIFAIHMPKSK